MVRIGKSLVKWMANLKLHERRWIWMTAFGARPRGCSWYWFSFSSFLKNVRKQSKYSFWANSMLNPYFEESELFKFQWNHKFWLFWDGQISFNLEFVPRGMFMLRRKAEQEKFSKMQIDKTNFKVNQNWASFVWPQNFLKFQQSLKLDE